MSDGVIWTRTNSVFFSQAIRLNRTVTLHARAFASGIVGHELQHICVRSQFVLAVGFMESSEPFTLDPIPPSLREEQAEEKRVRVRKNVANHREAATKKGLVNLNVFVPKALVERLDDVRHQEGVRSRAEALQIAVTGLLDPRHELMRLLVTDEAISAIDKVREANHLPKRADAIELVLRAALGNPSIKQELGL